MPQLDFDGANSKISADKIQGQSGTTVTIPAGHNLAGDGSGLTSLSAANLTGAMASGVTGVGYQAEADYFQMDMATASGTTVHNLTASFTPKVIWFNYNPNHVSSGMVTGWMTPMTGTNAFSGSSGVYWGTAGSFYYQNTKPQCGAGGSGYQYIWISSAGPGTYTVSNTKASVPTGYGYFSLILFG